jgi:SAM-dependent methyltransferase
MTSLADSSAVLVEINLPQHQAALTLLQGVLSDPACSKLKWLDLACGKGQIVAHLEKNLGVTARSKIELVGYDIENSYSKQAKQLAESKGLSSCRFEVGALSGFWQNPYTSGPWDFITLTNTAHEIAPESIAEIFIRCIERLDNNGCLFLYDMERLPNPELGAVPWTAAEMQAILMTLLRGLGCATYRPEVGQWEHRSCRGWNAQIKKSHLQLPSNYSGSIPTAIDLSKKHIHSLLEDRLRRVNDALESLAEYPAETGEEGDQKVALLYEFWAVYRALGGKL